MKLMLIGKADVLKRIMLSILEAINLSLTDLVRILSFVSMQKNKLVKSLNMFS